MVGCFVSVKYINVSTANCIFMTNPLFIALICYFWLGEKIGITEIIALIMAFFGVILINDPFGWVEIAEDDKSENPF